MPIKFTQWLLPDGRQRPVAIDRPAEVEALAEQLTLNGCHFDVEQMTSGEWSLTVERPHPDGDDADVLAWALCSDEEEIPRAVDQVIRAGAVTLLTQGSAPQPSNGTAPA